MIQVRSHTVQCRLSPTPSTSFDNLDVNPVNWETGYLSVSFSLVVHSLGILLFNVFHQHKLSIMTKTKCYIEDL